LADTWNDGATTFKGISLNVTDSASAAGSLLMDLQVGGSSRFNVNKNGIASGSGGYSSFRVSNLQGMDATGTSPIIAMFSGTNAAHGAGLLQLANTAMLAWGSGLASGTTGSIDTILVRDAANTLAQRNGVNAQAFNIYNTYTDASNYERGFVRWVSNALEIGADAAGTGNGSRNIVFRTGGSTPWRILGTGGALEPIASNQRDVGTTGSRVRTIYVGSSIENSGYGEFTEMTAPAAPAANNVRIYAEDNGSGKTRLMALFPTGVAQQIAIEP
jgi:hypothetical protein